ncbi:hypothetical protein TrCOL_g155 [Triparma columacea]|uniref:G patch domain-containing protein n=1 Tax=Triparma columacea TaxID=722753 RepID=A0A9W7GJT0_9STRA|nr:hypothetical protein TrCOL_g155 [Triparma columacea]
MAPPKLPPGSVTDAQGRRRFHGAFTGGFSAGYYNTVGSSEGWTPSTWSSSSAGKEGRREQRVEDFQDEEDGVVGGLGVRSEFKKEVGLGSERRRDDNPSSALGDMRTQGGVGKGLVDQVFARRVGKALLRTIGWKEERVMKLSPGSKGLKVPPPKLDFYGLGYRPYGDAPEFEDARRKREEMRAFGEREGGDVYRMSDVGRGGDRRGGDRGKGVIPSSSTALALQSSRIQGVQGFALYDGSDGVYDAGGGEYHTELQDVGSDDEGDFGGRGGGGIKFLDKIEEFAKGGGKAVKEEFTMDGKRVLEGFRLLKVSEGGGEGGGDKGSSIFLKRWGGPRVPLDFNEGHAFKEDEWGGGARMKREQEKRVIREGGEEGKVEVKSTEIRPPVDVFKSIFGNGEDSESESEEEEEKVEKVEKVEKEAKVGVEKREIEKREIRAEGKIIGSGEDEEKGERPAEGGKLLFVSKRKRKGGAGGDGKRKENAKESSSSDDGSSSSEDGSSSGDDSEKRRKLKKEIKKAKKRVKKEIKKVKKKEKKKEKKREKKRKKEGGKDVDMSKID